jgi:hypothetical protein
VYTLPTRLSCSSEGACNSRFPAPLPHGSLHGCLPLHCLPFVWGDRSTRPAGLPRGMCGRPVVRGLEFVSREFFKEDLVIPHSGQVEGRLCFHSTAKYRGFGGTFKDLLGATWQAMAPDVSGAGRTNSNPLPLEPCPQPFFASSCFSDRVSHFYLGWPQIVILLSLPPMQLGLQMCTTTPGKKATFVSLLPCLWVCGSLSGPRPSPL